jgi:riboflavin synthase
VFTGIVEAMGTIERVGPGKEGGRVLAIRSPFDPKTIAVGDSIAHSGVCLTVTRIEGSVHSVDVGPETLARTTLGALQAGARINLERSITIEQRLGGHLVQGHVDGVGRIVRLDKRDNAFDFDIEAPGEVLRLAVPRGSIAVDGISLTITGRTGETFSVSIIPHTWQVTTLSERKIGEGVNLEADLIARYIAGLLEVQNPGSSPLTEEFLRKHGF